MLFRLKNFFAFSGKNFRTGDPPAPRPPAHSLRGFSLKNQGGVADAPWEAGRGTRSLGRLTVDGQATACELPGAGLGAGQGVEAVLFD